MATSAGVPSRLATTREAAGGHLVSDKHAAAWWTLAEAEGNEADVATIMGRD